MGGERRFAVPCTTDHDPQKAPLAKSGPQSMVARHNRPAAVSSNLLAASRCLSPRRGPHWSIPGWRKDPKLNMSVPHTFQLSPRVFFSVATS